MPEKYLKIVLEALAEKIDRLNAEVFIRDFDNEKLKEENEKLRKTVKILEKAIAQEVINDG